MEAPIEDTATLERASRYSVALPKRIVSLRQQLLYGLIPAIAIPLCIGTAFGYRSIEEKSREQSRADLNKSVLATQEILNRREQLLVPSGSIGDRNFSQAIKEAKTFLGFFQTSQSQIVQILDLGQEQLLETISFAEDSTVSQSEIVGGTKLLEVASALAALEINSSTSAEDIALSLPKDIAIKNVAVVEHQTQSSAKFTFSFADGGRHYSLVLVPDTSFAVVASAEKADIAGDTLLLSLLSIVAVLTVLLAISTAVLARQIANPLRDLAVKAEEAASGNFSVRADLVGSTEAITLANSFNNLIQQVDKSLQQQETALRNAETVRQQAEDIAQEQQEKNARVQQELLTLLEDVEGASGGDLTVRSQIVDGEIGIVADFFNSIIESLREIVARVKQGSEQVNQSVGENQGKIDRVAQEARQQAEQISQTLTSVAQITQSIQEVAANAKEAAKVAHIASNKAEQGGQGMELTVNSIQQLRGTIGQTADKVKSLGDASQKISRVISLIDRIAIQTNLLAINASIEAARAGEEGQGFAVVAEEVGELATQSSEATKEVAAIIAGIQKEVLQVVEAMEVGLAQAEEGTSRVETTKRSLQQIVAVSYQIDNLVRSISEATVSQAHSSQTVTELMEQIALISSKTSQFSEDAYSSLESTVAIAQELQSSVGTFKIQQED